MTASRKPCSPQRPMSRPGERVQRRRHRCVASVRGGVGVRGGDLGSVAIDILAAGLSATGRLRSRRRQATPTPSAMAAARPSPCASPTQRRSARSLLNPELQLGEAYMDGTFVVEQGSIADVLAILLRQERIAPPKWALPSRLVRYLFRRLQQFNPRSRSRRNVAHHYDLDGRLYSLFLDADQQYSCAYFEDARPVARRRPARQEAPPRRQAAASNPAPRCSISAAAGAAWPSISPRSPARA